MKKIFCAITCFIFMTVQVSVAAADCVSESALEELVSINAITYAESITNCRKLDDVQKARLVRETGNINLADTNVYVIEKSIDNETREISVITDAAIMASGSSGEVSENGTSARVVAKCVLGYDKLVRNTITYKKGLYYGGKIVSQPNSSVINSLQGSYGENGAYITQSGNSGITSYNDSAIFNCTYHTTLQTKTLNRVNYYNSEAPGYLLSARYDVGGIVNGNYPFSFYVVAAA